jgi:hypothetical protein
VFPMRYELIVYILRRIYFLKDVGLSQYKIRNLSNLEVLEIPLHLHCGTKRSRMKYVASVQRK